MAIIMKKNNLKKNIYTKIISIYSKYVPFWFVKLFPQKTAPMRLRFNFIKKLAQKNNIKIFIETGTYLGETTNSLSKYFEKIYTFEISKELTVMAKKRFKKQSHIEVINEDSGEGLPKLLQKIDKKTIFWLDGHFSEGAIYSKKNDLNTPIIKEMIAIFESKIKNLNNIILIDDAFEFDGTRGYPTLEELKKIIYTYKNNYNIYIKYNIIFICPTEVITNKKSIKKNKLLSFLK